MEVLCRLLAVPVCDARVLQSPMLSGVYAGVIGFNFNPPAPHTGPTPVNPIAGEESSQRRPS